MPMLRNDATECLRGLGLELSGGAEVRHEGDVQEEDVVAADVVADLASGFEEGLRFDVAGRCHRFR